MAKKTFRHTKQKCVRKLGISLHDEELRDLFRAPSIVRMVKSMRL
jgi:hypothetical protein